MGGEARDDLMRRGRAALAEADWEAARSCFEAARGLGDTAEALDGLSQAVHFQGDYDRAIELKERAFAAYRRDGRRVEAAELARWLAFLHVSRPYRRRGAAQALWNVAADIAVADGAESIYVSATPTESAVGFYLRQGCRLAHPVHPDLFAAEPEDIHLVRSLR